MSRSSALHIAAGVNDAAALDDVLRLPPMQQQTALCSRDSGKNTPLHIASYKGHLEFVLKMLSSCTLEHYALDLPNLVNDNGNTPLHLAVLGNNPHVIHALMSASPPSRLDVKDKQGYTPMHYACGEGYLDIVKSLYSLGATFDVTNSEGLTPLMCCSQQGHPEVVRFIVDKDPPCVFFCNAAGDTALHYAGVAVARVLILAGADISKKNCEGLTCCDEARADGRGDFVAFVLAVQQDLNAAMRRAQGDAHVLRSLVTDVFEVFDSGSKVAADRPQLPVLPGDGSRKFKFSSSRATLRVKTTVELLLDEQREAAEGGAAAAAAPAPKPKPKSRIMFSS